MQPPTTISLGDILKKVALKSFQELKVLVDAFPAQSPELRAEKLDAVIKKAKIKEICANLRNLNLVK